MYAGFIFVCSVLSDLSFHTECSGLLKCVVCGVLYDSQVCTTSFPCLLWSTVRLVEVCCFLIGVCALALLVVLCVVLRVVNLRFCRAAFYEALGRVAQFAEPSPNQQQGHGNLSYGRGIYVHTGLDAAQQVDGVVKLV